MTAGRTPSTPIRRGALPTLAAVVALSLGMAACDSLGPGAQSSVHIGFRSPSGGSASVSGLDAARSAGAGLSPALQFDGSNGTLSISSAHLVVTDFEIDRTDANCDDGETEGAENEEGCEEFEAEPQFLDVPLDGGTTVTVSQAVPPGQYSGLKFEVDDLEDDDGGSEHQSEQELLQEIRSQFAQWPQEASLRVTGTFTPSESGAEPRDFTAYFEAEIEIEKEFDTPLTIEEGSGDQTVTVTVDPSAWFTRSDGTVVDLSQFDYQSTGSVAELEFEMEKGFTETEFEGDDDG